MKWTQEGNSSGLMLRIKGRTRVDMFKFYPGRDPDETTMMKLYHINGHPHLRNVLYSTILSHLCPAQRELEAG